jgi:hypothetical protein
MTQEELRNRLRKALEKYDVYKDKQGNYVLVMKEL